MSNEVLFPIIASLITLILTKIFDLFMASRKNQIDTLSTSLTSIDEIAGAAQETISYLKEEISDLRAEVRELKKSVEEKDQVIKELAKLANGNAKKILEDKE